MADDNADKKPEDEVRFELRLAARLTPSTARSAAPVDPVREQRRHIQETGRRLMEPFMEEMMLGMVHDHRTCKDFNMRFKIAKYFLDQCIGSPKPLTEEEKKGADAGTILDVLAAMSAKQGSIEREGRNTPVLEHDKAPQSVEDMSKLLDQFSDNIEDGEIVDG